MNSFSPMAEGFRLIIRRPAVAVAEIAWRWSFVAATWVLAILFAVEYLDTLPASALDRLLLATRQPILVVRAIRRIFHGSALRFTEGAVLLAFALALAWILLASFGRAATLSSLLDDVGVERGSSGRRFFSSLVGLNFIRLAVTLAALIASIGAAVMANSFWAAAHVSPAEATRVFGLLLCLIGLVWSALNWLLSTAAIPVLSQGKASLAALSSTLVICQQLAGPVLATGLSFLLLHLAALVAACGMGFFILGAAGTLGIGLALFIAVTIAIAYCAVADFLYTARMAAYVCLIYVSETPSYATPIGAPLIAGGSLSHIDQSELILSDVPSPS
jgi:hypothetical protein